MPFLPPAPRTANEEEEQLAAALAASLSLAARPPSPGSRPAAHGRAAAPTAGDRAAPQPREPPGAEVVQGRVVAEPTVFRAQAADPGPIVFHDWEVLIGLGTEAPTTPVAGDDRCFRCGRTGHWSNVCGATPGCYVVFAARDTPQWVGLHLCTWTQLCRRLHCLAGQLREKGIYLRKFDTYGEASAAFEQGFPRQAAADNVYDSLWDV